MYTKYVSYTSPDRAGALLLPPVIKVLKFIIELVYIHVDIKVDYLQMLVEFHLDTSPDTCTLHVLLIHICCPHMNSSLQHCHRTGSNYSGAEDYLRRKTNIKTQKIITQL